MLPRRLGFIAGTGGAKIGSTGGPPFCGKFTSGTEEVLETKVGSDIMALTIDFFLAPAGAARPGSVGVMRPLPTDAGFGECKADSGGDIGIEIGA